MEEKDAITTILALIVENDFKKVIYMNTSNNLQFSISLDRNILKLLHGTLLTEMKHDSNWKMKT